MAEKTKSKKKVTLYITDGGRLFSKEDLEKYVIPTRSQQAREETQWGRDVIEPPYDLNKLMEWLHISVVHASCIHAKVNDSFGIGWNVRANEKAAEEQKATPEQIDMLTDFFSKCNESEDIGSVCKKVGLDYEGCGNGYFEVVRGTDIEKSIKAIYHVNGTTIRLTRDREKWVQQVGTITVYFKKWGDDRIMDKTTGKYVEEIIPEKAANELIPIQQYTHKSPWYGLPEWIPAIFQMYGELKEKEFNLDFFTNYGIPSYAVIMEGTDEVDKELKEEIQAYFETEVKNNPHRTMVFGTPSGVTLRFEQLATEAKEASFRIYRRDNRDDILTAHHVPPYRASIVVSGQLGGTVAEDVDRIYLDSVVNPRQNAFAWILTELIIKEGFDIPGGEFVWKDVDIRDKKSDADIASVYFNLGVMTPNELRQAQGLAPYEGGDVFYIGAAQIPVGTSPSPLYKSEKEQENGTKPGASKPGKGDPDESKDYRSQEDDEDKDAA